MRTLRFLAVILFLPNVCFSQSIPAIDDIVLEKLREASEISHTDALVILRDGAPIVEWYREDARRPIELMSVLKSLVSLGVGRLLTVGKIESLDQRVADFYPEWKQGQKQNVAIRHLLNHTSGMQNNSNAGVEIYPSPNAIKLALAAELTSEPGSKFAYNNKAVNLLAGIIEKADGRRMDRFFVDEFFARMNIDEYQWFFDGSGNPHAMAGLRLHALDLAKFGQLVLDGGLWEGERFVSEEYIAKMLAQGQPYNPLCGLLWWRFAPTKSHVKTENGIIKLRHEDILAFNADGYLGQTLIIVPESRIVAVRQVRNSESYDRETDGFKEFKDLILELVKDSPL